MTREFVRKKGEEQLCWLLGTPVQVFVEDQEVIQTFSSHTSQKAFTDSIQRVRAAWISFIVLASRALRQAGKCFL